jgi:4-amino-4-deoxy-L-arabinose transferase-like glycosyltransferase
MASIIKAQLRQRRLWIILGYALLMGARALWPERPILSTGPRALWDAFFALGFAGFVLYGGLAVGRLFLAKLDGPESLSSIEAGLFSTALGLAVLSLATLVLGLTGLLRPIWLALLVGAFLVGSHRWWGEPMVGTVSGKRKLHDWWRQSSALERAAVCMVLLITLGSLLQTLSPPWSFDALVYHLAAPKQYLQAGRLVFLPRVWQADGPMGIEMLFTLGLAMGSAPVARTLHLVLTGLLVASAYAFARRFLDGDRAKWAALILLGIPILPLWGSIANIDSGWALYEFLALYSIICWVVYGERSWLILGALLAGFSLQTKYLALAGCATAAGLVAYHGLRSSTRSLRPVLLFTAIAGLVGSPWYVLNLIRTGNPVFPFLFGGSGWGGDRLAYLMTFLGSFGPDAKLASLPLAPIWLYTRHELYASFMSSLEYPSFLFPLCILLFFTRPPKALRWLAAAATIRFLLWGLTSQQTRFLLPLFPGLAVLSAHSLSWLAKASRRASIRRVLSTSLIGGLLASTLVYQGVFWLTTNPGGVLVGTESKDAFLRRNASTYAAQRYIQQHLDQNARVLMLWDGQSFYCDQRCLPDPEQTIWPRIVEANGSVPEVAGRLTAIRVTHLLVRVDSLNFMLIHDPTGWQTVSIDFLLTEFGPACLRAVYDQDEVFIGELTCGAAAAAGGPAIGQHGS